MPLNPSATELTTAGTDLVLGLLCFAIVWRLAAMPARAAWKQALWCWVFGLLGLGSVLGAVAHGLDLSDAVRTALWWPLYVSLGLTVALFVVAGVGDWRGARAAKALLPWAIAIGVGFFALTELLGGAFRIFIVYEAAAMAATLAIYVALSVTGRVAGARTIALGIGLSLVAAGVQASALGVRLIVPFDHNGLFHLVQMAATVVLAVGVGRGLEAGGAGPDSR